MLGLPRQPQGLRLGAGGLHPRLSGSRSKAQLLALPQALFSAASPRELVGRCCPHPRVVPGWWGGTHPHPWLPQPYIPKPGRSPVAKQLFSFSTSLLIYLKYIYIYMCTDVGICTSSSEL